MMIKNRFIPILLGTIVLILVVGCESHPKKPVEQVISYTKEHFVPDSRVQRFNVEAHAGTGDSLILKGQTTLAEAKSSLLDSLNRKHIAFIDSIEVLPTASLKSKTHGLVNNSVANIRSKPRHAAQLATQALLGMPLKILKKYRGWYLARTPDDYISWVNSSNIQLMNKSQYSEWENSSKLIYKKTYGFSYQKPSESAGHVTDLVAGDIVRRMGSRGHFYHIRYPDGRTAFVPKNEASPFERWNNKLQVTKKSLVNEAKTMMGAPYLWGGTSTKGMDCSGFTKTIYFMNGRILPRDASQQVYAGTQVDKKKQWKNLEVGDLLFFGHAATDSTEQRVVHVGMWIGDDQFIHSSGNVHISSVDAAANNYDPYNVGRYLEARRYLGNWRGNIMQTAEMYKWGDEQ